MYLNKCVQHFFTRIEGSKFHVQESWVNIWAIAQFSICRGLSKSDLGNVWPAGHMRPAKHLNVAREHFLGSL